MPLLKTLLFTILVPASVTVVVPFFLVGGDFSAPDRDWIWVAGVIILSAGAGVYMKCAWDFASFGKGTPAPLDPPKRFVARALYRIVRNPMYAGVVLVLLGEAIALRSTKLLAYALVICSFFHLFVIFYEEPTLRMKFGDSYEEYCKRVPRWFPAWYRKKSG